MISQSKIQHQANNLIDLLENNYVSQQSKLKQAQNTYKSALHNLQYHREVNTQLWQRTSQLINRLRSLTQQKLKNFNKCQQKATENFTKIEQKISEKSAKYFYKTPSFQMSLPQIQVPQSIVQKQNLIEDQQKQWIDLMEDDVTKMKIKIQLTQIQIRQFQTTAQSQKRKIY